MHTLNAFEKRLPERAVGDGVGEDVCGRGVEFAVAPGVE